MNSKSKRQVKSSKGFIESLRIIRTIREGGGGGDLKFWRGPGDFLWGKLASPVVWLFFPLPPRYLAIFNWISLVLCLGWGDRGGGEGGGGGEQPWLLLFSPASPPHHHLTKPHHKMKVALTKLPWPMVQFSGCSALHLGDSLVMHLCSLVTFVTNKSQWLLTLVTVHYWCLQQC